MSRCFPDIGSTPEQAKINAEQLKKQLSERVVMTEDFFVTVVGGSDKEEKAKQALRLFERLAHEVIDEWEEGKIDYEKL